MKILLLCHKPPLPSRDGGSIATYSLVSALVKLNHTLDLLAMTTPKHDMGKNGTEIYKGCNKVRFVYVNTGINIIKLLLNLVCSRLPYVVTRFRSAGFEKQLSLMLLSGGYDIVQLESVYLMLYADTIKKTSASTVVLRTHNAEFEIWKHLSNSHGNFLNRLYYRFLYKRMYRFESEAINKYDLLVTLTDHDLLQYNKMGNTKPALVNPAGIDLTLSDRSTETSERATTEQSCKTLFFLGSLDYMPNQEAVLWFVRNVFNLLFINHPNIKFNIAGRNAPAWLIKKLEQPGVVFRGEIKNASDFIRSNDICIVPCFSGSGIRIKIIEAMYFGKPVITTPLGAQGIEATVNKEILIAENSDEFSSTIEKLLGNHAFYTNISWNAAQLIRDKYNNLTLSDNLVHFYKTHMK